MRLVAAVALIQLLFVCKKQSCCLSVADLVSASLILLLLSVGAIFALRGGIEAAIDELLSGILSGLLVHKVASRLVGGIEKTSVHLVHRVAVFGWEEHLLVGSLLLIINSLCLRLLLLVHSEFLRVETLGRLPLRLNRLSRLEGGNKHFRVSLHGGKNLLVSKALGMA